MSDKDFMLQIYHEIIAIKGKFDFEKATEITFKYCPDNYTKKAIKRLTISILNEAYDNDMINMINDKTFISAMSKENNM